MEGLERRRSYFEIIERILTITGRPCGSTQVAYLADLNGSQSQHYLDYLCSVGMLTARERFRTGLGGSRLSSEGSLYRITPRGRKLLRHFQAMNRILGPRALSQEEEVEFLER